MDASENHSVTQFRFSVFRCYVCQNEIERDQTTEDRGENCSTGCSTFVPSLGKFSRTETSRVPNRRCLRGGRLRVNKDAPPVSRVPILDFFVLRHLSLHVQQSSCYRSTPGVLHYASFRSSGSANRSPRGTREIWQNRARVGYKRTKCPFLFHSRRIKSVDFSSILAINFYGLFVVFSNLTEEHGSTRLDKQ